MLLASGRLLQSGSSQEIATLYLQGVANVSTLEVDTAKTVRRDNLGERMRITSLSINTGLPLCHGKSASFLIRFRSSQSATGIAFHVAFCAPDGTRIMCADLDIPGEKMSIAANSEGVVTLFIDAVHLEPASYAVNVAIRSGDTFLLDYLLNVTTVTVLPSELTPPGIAMRSGGLCEVRYPCSARLELEKPELSRSLQS